jgi:uncharacterized protein YoaH (UPF0181 family)
MANTDEDGHRSGMGNTKGIKAALDAASVSAVITLAMQAGKSSGVAATLVAEHLGLGAHDARSVQKLLQSRKNLMGKRASSEARAQYHLMMSSAAKARADGMSHDETLSLALEYLRDKLMAQKA